MEDAFEDAAARISDALSVEGRLRLYEIRLLLGRTREFVAEVLTRLLLKEIIKFYRENHVLYVTFSDVQERAGDKGRALRSNARGE